MNAGNIISYGYTKHRRREQALLVQNVVAWKLRQAFLEADDPTCQAYNYTNTLRDVSNAFPSPDHDEMDKMVDELADGKLAQLLKLRYRQSWMVISTLKGERVIYQPKTGGLQGDCIMPEMFAALYEPVIDE